MRLQGSEALLPPYPCPLLTPYFPKVDWTYLSKVTLPHPFPLPPPPLGKQEGVGISKGERQKPLDLVGFPGAKIGEESWIHEGKGPQEVGLVLQRVEGLLQSQFSQAGWLPGN